MSADPPSNELDVTLRRFVAGQKLFRRYTLISTLGRGGMGIVWLAQDEELERKVALKFLPSLVAHDRALLSDLKRETRRSLELTHNNIVRIYDFVQDEQSACISMEDVDGDTLAEQRVEKEGKVFQPPELVSWITQACEALDFAHQHARVVHCDIKPSNLMVNSKEILKITDFGIARSLSDSASMLTMKRGTTGTLVFMSPQQLDGEGASHLDDIYSLGATLFDLLTGKPPFYRGQIDRQIRERIPPSLASRRAELDIVGGELIPDHWEDTIAACLAKDPTKRPQRAIHVAERLKSQSTSHRQVHPKAVDIASIPDPPLRLPDARLEEKRLRTKPIRLAAICLLVLTIGGAGLYFALSANKAARLQTSGPSAAVVSSPGPVDTSTPSAAAGDSPSALVRSTAERLLKEATELRDRGDTTNALARLHDAAKSDPKNANVLAQMAMIYESIQLFERSNETWRKIQEIGPSAGGFYELAELKVKNKVTVEGFVKEATNLRDRARTDSPPGIANEEGIPDGSTFGITEVTATDTPDAYSETNMKLKIAVKARPNTSIDHKKVKIQVFFYDTLDNKEVMLTDADVSYEWLTPHHDWKATNPEILAVTYLRAKNKPLSPDAAWSAVTAVTPPGGPQKSIAKKTSVSLPGEGGKRKYLGYIVRIYYNDQLQAVRANPPKLLNLFPPPFIAPQ